MTTLPTTDGDTKAAMTTLQQWDNEPEHKAALDLITTRISEQEVELERLRQSAKSVLWVFDGNASTEERRAALSSLRFALTPTTQDQSESSGEG